MTQSPSSRVAMRPAKLFVECGYCRFIPIRPHVNALAAALGILPGRSAPNLNDSRYTRECLPVARTLVEFCQQLRNLVTIREPFIYDSIGYVFHGQSI
jgi:hypothetical protein